MKACPRLLIAAVRSGSGKTSIATGLMGALVRRGYRVQGFKVGPDFIDPSYHTAVTGRWSRNLDTWLLPTPRVQELFLKAVQNADLAVIEGVMGVFDGLGGKGERASSAEIAKLLGCPVVLVLDVHAQARSAVAEYLGCRAMDPDLPLAGVILNRVQGERHLEMLREAFTSFQVPILGAVRAESLPRLTERHLGLIPVPERRPGGTLDRLVQAVGEQLDLAAVLDAAATAPGCSRSSRPGGSGRGFLVPGAAGRSTPRVPGGRSTPQGGERVRVAYAWDEAFNFYYRDGLAELERWGAELVPFSPLHDCSLPAGTRGILIGGGFPELFAAQLAANQGMRASLQEANAAGLPIYAECGGFMYLCCWLRDLEGREHPMVGLIPGGCRMEKRLAGMGYVTARALTDNLLCRAGEELPGHEFHYSTFIPEAAAFPWAFSFQKGARDAGCSGYARGNLLASYLHYHFAASPGVARCLVERCRTGKFPSGRP